MHGRRLVDHAIEVGVVRHVGDDAPHVEPVALQARRLRGDRAGVDVDQRDLRAVRREHLAVGEPEPAGTAGDDHAETRHVETRGNVHLQLPPESSLPREPIAAATVPPMSDYNRGIIEEFRANGGRVGGRWEGRDLLLLTTTGRKSGRRHTTPIVFTRSDDRLLVYGSNSGGLSHPTGISISSPTRRSSSRWSERYERSRHRSRGRNATASSRRRSRATRSSATTRRRPTA